MTCLSKTLMQQVLEKDEPYPISNLGNFVTSPVALGASRSIILFPVYQRIKFKVLLSEKHSRVVTLGTRTTWGEAALVPLLLSPRNNCLTTKDVQKPLTPKQGQKTLLFTSAHLDFSQVFQIPFTVQKYGWLITYCKMPCSHKCMLAWLSVHCVCVVLCDWLVTALTTRAV